MKQIVVIIGILFLASCQKNDVVNQIETNKEFNIKLQCDYQVEIYNSCTQAATHYDAGIYSVPWNGTYFGTDSVHPIQTGMDAIFNYVKPIIFI